MTTTTANTVTIQYIAECMGDSATEEEARRMLDLLRANGLADTSIDDIPEARWLELIVEADGRTPRQRVLDLVDGNTAILRIEGDLIVLRPGDGTTSTIPLATAIRIEEEHPTITEGHGWFYGDHGAEWA